MKTTRHRLAITLASAALLLALSAGAANADVVVYDEHGNLVLRPHRIYLTTPTVLVDPTPSITVLTPTPSAPSIVVVKPTRRDPYDTSGLVIAGAGVGGLLLRGSGITSLVPTYRLHLGLAVGQAQIGLRSNIAPNAITLDNDTETPNDVSIYATRLTFDYRFLQGVPVHPIAGAGLEALIADPRVGDTGFTLAATARVGLEFAYPLGHSALAVGIDATGHLPLARSDKMVIELSAMLSFGAYLDFRF